MQAIPTEIIDAIRVGRLPTNAHLEQYIHWPLIDSLRCLVGTESFEGVCRLIQSTHLSTRNSRYRGLQAASALSGVSGFA